jgi:hypothetical protein
MTNPGKTPTIQQIKDLESDIAKLLNDVGVQNTNAINTVGGITVTIYTAATAAATLGPVGWAAAAVSLVTEIFSLLDPSSGQAQAAAAEFAQIQKELAQILQGAEEEAADLRLTNIQNGLSGAQSVAGSMQDLKNHLPLPSPEVTEQMEDILKSMSNLAPPADPSSGPPGGPWMVPYDYQQYWTDDHSSDLKDIRTLNLKTNGYGDQAPATSGNVFNYTWVLPAYLYTVSTLISVGLIIDPTFQQDRDPDVAAAASLLQSVHDYIYKTGMTKLSPGPCSYQNLSQWWSNVQIPSFFIGNPNQAIKGIIPGPSSQVGTLPLDLPDNKRSIRIEYGVVEKFSGFGSVGMYSLQGPFDENFNYDGAFQIRLESRNKDVYVGTGLKGLQDTIDSLNHLLGKPTSTGPGPGDWSFRHDIAGPANVTRADGTLHLSDLMAYLKENSPADPSWQALTSVRDLLTHADSA